MAYEIGQKVCLWQEEVTRGRVTVLKEVIATITHTKTGVPGQCSREPVSYQSLRGLGDDGKVYEKHWEAWPESQTNDFLHQWSVRDDGEGDNDIWSPKEAVHAYNEVRRHNNRHGEKYGFIERTNKNGDQILPKGDFAYCEKHDEYGHPGQQCFECLREERAA